MRDIKAEAEAIRQLDPTAHSDAEAGEIMRSFMREYTTAPNSIFMPSTYRARTNIGQELFSSKKELWAPPADKATRGRFNDTGEAVLYLSATPLGAIWEMRPTSGSWITVLVGRQNYDSQPLKLVSIGMEQFRDDEKTGIFSSKFSGGVRSVSHFQEFLKGHGIEQQWLDQDDFLAELATKNFGDALKTDHYKFTRPIRDFFVKASNPRSGLLYPSVECGLRAFNIALELDAAECVDCVEAWVFDIREIVQPEVEGGEKRFFGPVIYRGMFDSNDNIQWGPRGEWSLDFIHSQFISNQKKPPTHEGLSPMANKPKRTTSNVKFNF